MKTGKDKTPRTVLEIRNVSKRFGGLLALNEVDLMVRQGEIVSLIGPNGAGKTTLFNCVTSIYTPDEGRVLLSDSNGTQHSLAEKKPFEVTALGMARTFQNIRLFPSMTVLENVMIARHCRTRAGILGALFRPSSVLREERQIEEDSYSLLNYMGLGAVFEEQARNLPYGQQRRLEIARALATNPHLLLLDEPAAGMNPQETRELRRTVQTIREQFNLSILLIEHDMSMVMSVSDRIYVMEYGCNIAEGTPEEVRNNPQVIKAYLGGGDA
ncbi:ABC transporter ATP-binding protein [Desulfovibrio sp. OttesenSCG-928-F20]|nr:ABC transporter ATP-binding protein [Desulfovibrio sp. OttesenSCG-928-F20]